MTVKKKKLKKQLVPRTRNLGTWTESRYFQQIRNCLRKGFQFWKPMMKALDGSRRPNQSSNIKLKWEYHCASCDKWFARKDINIDHITECGSLKTLEDVVSFITNLTPEDPRAFQILCKPCHLAKTQAYMKAKR